MMILHLLSDGKGYTARQMSATLGLSLQQVISAMNCLRKNKAMRAVDQPYVITEQGHAWRTAREAKAKKAKEPKPRKEVDNSLPILHDDNPEPPFEHRLVAAPAVADSVVAAAIQGRHALQSAWGAPR